MARQFELTQTGRTINVTLAADITVGDILVSNGLALVANETASSGEVIAMDAEGVFKVAAKTIDTFAVGTQCYWDSTNTEVTTTATGNDLIGRAVTPKAGAAAGTVEVKINVA